MKVGHAYAADTNITNISIRAMVTLGTGDTLTVTNTGSIIAGPAF